MTIATIKLNLSIIACAILLTATFTGCSENGGSDSGSAGGIAYQLSWNSQSPLAPERYPVGSTTGDVCEDYNIQWIHAQAVDQNGTEQAKERWACTQRSGELKSIPAGTYNILIEGQVENAITWRGEATGVSVTENQKTNAGVINMNHQRDHDAPVVVRTDPQDGSQNVPVDSAVTATFDDAIVAPSIGPKNMILTYVEPSGEIKQVAGEIRYDGINHTAVITPSVPLFHDTTYTASVTVDGDMVVEDIAGNPMQENFQWRFTTFRPDAEGPWVLSRTPEKDTMEVSPSTIVQIRFSEPIDPQSISMDSIRLERNGTSIQCETIYDDQLSIVTLKPVGDLLTGSTINVVITTDIVDLAGNPMEIGDSWSFVTQFPTWHTEIVPGYFADITTRIVLESSDKVHIAIRSYGEEEGIDLVRVSNSNWNAYPMSSQIGPHFDMTYDHHLFRTLVCVSHLQNELQLKMVARPPGGPLGFGIIQMDDPLNNLKGISMDSFNGDNRGGNVAVCFYDASSAELKYNGPQTLENNETVDTASGEYCDIAVSDSTVPHISFQDQTSQHLRYATRTSSGAWSKTTVDAGTAVGEHTAIAHDMDDNPHISYRDESNASLKYAYRQPSGDWLIETVDSSVTIGDALSIAVDSFGQAHISYRDTFNNALKYATRTGIGRWHTALIDREGPNGYGSSIAVDSQDYVHISYCESISNVAGDQVRYATTRPQN